MMDYEQEVALVGSPFRRLQFDRSRGSPARPDWPVLPARMRRLHRNWQDSDVPGRGSPRRADWPVLKLAAGREGAATRPRPPLSRWRLFLDELRSPVESVGPSIPGALRL